jgi:hypothetical protein
MTEAAIAGFAARMVELCHDRDRSRVQGLDLVAQLYEDELRRLYLQVRYMARKGGPYGTAELLNQLWIGAGLYRAERYLHLEP